MTLSTQHSRRVRRRRPLLRWAIFAAVLAVVFGAGVAVGQALEERPRTGEPVTRTATFQPWTQTQP